MMRRTAVAAGLAVAAWSLVVASAEAGGQKRLPKAISLVESKRESHLTHYVRTEIAKPAPAQSGALKDTKPYSPSHPIREMPESR